ncbi:MAG: WD40 repeat domain-containing protein [Propionibacteriaceae bacterium]|nr:WD40 repeat domain-containing protein [Propionibacteriaceae bacterium]
MTREIISLFPHGSYPWAVACRSDGRFLAVGSHSRTVTVWDLANRTPARTLIGHPGPVDAVCWSPDGASILTSSQGVSWLWSVATARRLHEVPALAGLVPVAWYGEVILAMTARRVVTVDASGELLHDFGPPSLLRWRAALSPDGARLALVDASMQITVRDSRTGEEVGTFPTDGHLDALGWTPDSRHLVGSGHSPTRIWEPTSGELIRQLPASAAVRFSPDASRLLEVPNDDHLRVLEAATGEELHRLELGSWCHFAIWHPDGRHVIAPTKEGSIQLWDIQPRRAKQVAVLGGDHTPEASENRVVSAYFRPGDDALTTASANGRLRLWGSDGALMSEAACSAELVSGPQSAWSPDGTRLLVSNRYRTEVREVPTGRLLSHRDHLESSKTLTWSPDGTRVAGGCDMFRGKGCWIWDPTTGETLHTLLGKDVEATWTAWSPDGGQLAAGVLLPEGGFEIRVWDSHSGKRLRTFNGFDWGVAARWSPDGARILAQDIENGPVQVIDALSGELIQNFDPDEAEEDAAFDWEPATNTVALGREDGAITLWRLDDGKRLHQLRGHAGGITSVQFSTDGSHLVSLSTDRTVRVWDVATGTQVGFQIDSLPEDQWVTWTPDGTILHASSEAHRWLAVECVVDGEKRLLPIDPSELPA